MAERKSGMSSGLKILLVVLAVIAVFAIIFIS